MRRSPRGTYAVDSDSDVGDRDVDGLVQDDRAARTSTRQTNVGDVRRRRVQQEALGRLIAARISLRRSNGGRRERRLAWRSVQLSPSDQSKLLLAVAGMVARDRRERGVKLNQPEAVALLSCWVIERAREGRCVAELMDAGRRVLAREDVMEGVPELVAEVQVEATFPDGRKLVTLHEPIA